MNSLVGLVKKDLMISRFLFIVWFAINILFMIGSFFLSKYMHEPMVPIGIFIMLLVLNTMLIPVLVSASLRVEGKTQLWLYNPQSSTKLLLSKIITAISYQVISLILLFAYGYIVFKFSISSTINLDSILINESFSVSIFLMALGLYLTFWIMFYWAIYHSLGKFPRIRRVRWLVIVVIFIGLSIIEDLILKIDAFSNLLDKWHFSIGLNPSFQYKNETWDFTFVNTNFPLIPILIYFIISLILFVITSWLLDKKVEV
ncbi:hypothetical protein M3589_05165 [Heyndrickxia oleronia]|uniref:ABC transporter permease n=1 Tax=Heyndrickxia oleronia TaxID=38875 RepID=A0AAW6SN50_9BACI|nr:hypothetical protein [Heyndrickxia oleronia]MCM3237116.1 hypothetical protein [Heyndrickxia oleronia]MDH5160241.1 hypothetical protein [Heyndrickxia oleronia]